MAELKVSEAQLQEHVLELAQLTGWTVAHFRPARVGNPDEGEQRWVTPVAADGKGFPDLVLVHPQRGVLFRELKSSTGRVRDDQQAWLDVLVAAGADAGVWRPSDLDDIRQTLTGSAS